MSRDLLTENRLHDLPPLWDGHPVTWGEWEKGIEGAVFVCPPPKVPDHCVRCGSVELQIRNRGLVRPVPLVLTPWVLWVWRCPDCYLDDVWDLATDEWWTLDDTDYEDDGSNPPSAPEPPPAPRRSAKDRALERSRAAVAAARADADQGTLF